MANHVVPSGRYYAVFGALLALTLTTYLVADAPLGEWHVPVALGIAVVKAALVALIFMHLIQSTRLTWLVVAAGLFTLALLISFTLADYWTRAWMPQRPHPGTSTVDWWRGP